MPVIQGVHVSWVALAAFGAACAATLALGGLFTEVGAWYASLEKPSWTPPGAVIGAAWWTIFTLVAVAMAHAWSAGPRDARAWLLVALLVVNLVLNAGWSWFFFTRRDPRGALIVLVLLWLSIVALGVAASSRSRLAVLLLMPYLGWVSFAGVLNAAIVRLNA